MSEKPRIIGSEMEWPMTVWHTNSETPQQFTNTSSLKTRLPAGLVTVGQGYFMLSNGARYYSDIGDRVEYATPETTSFDDLAVRELAGEQIVMHGLLEHARTEEKIETLVLSKRVTDSFNEGWGYHLNLSADRQRIPTVNDGTMHLLALHLITSNPMLGGGSVFHGSDGKLHYSFSQKALSLTSDYSAGTTKDKPLINLRDESLANGKNLRRIHLTSVDPHISPWATKMAAGTISLVLRAIEQGKGKELELERRTGNYVLKTLNRQIALDLDMNMTLDMAERGTMKALDVQEEILSIVQETEHTTEEASVLQEWGQALNILRSQPEKLVQSDALCKLALMRAWTRRNDVEDFNHQKILGIDDQMSRLFTYHKRVDMEKSISSDDIYKRSQAAKLRSGLFKAYMPPEEHVISAITEPPTTTRAYGRGKAIATGKVLAVNWDSYRLEDQLHNFEILDPYIPDLGNVAQLDVS